MLGLALDALLNRRDQRLELRLKVAPQLRIRSL
jgi:hypothetical protein